MSAVAGPSPPRSLLGAARPVELIAAACAMPLAAVGALLTLARAGGAHVVMPCPMSDELGLACPVCGVGRSADALVAGDHGAVVAQLPAVAVIAVIAAMAAWTGARALRRRPPGPRVARWYLGLLLGVLALNWVMQIVRALGG